MVLASKLIGRFAAAAVLAAFAMVAAPGEVLAQDSCQRDFSIIQKKRMAQIAALNKMAKRNKGKMDPRAACPRLRRLAKIEAELVGYMKKNKDWCQIPDNAIQGATKARARTVQLSGQACAVAAKIRRMQRQARQNAGPAAPPRPKLPAGPL